MINFWRFDVKSKKDVDMLASVTHRALARFVKKCDPDVELTEENGEEWVMRYIVEEKDYSPEHLISLEVEGIDYSKSR